MIGPTRGTRQYQIIIRGECGHLLARLIDNVDGEPAQAVIAVSLRWCEAILSFGDCWSSSGTWLCTS